MAAARQLPQLAARERRGRSQRTHKPSGGPRGGCTKPSRVSLGEPELDGLNKCLAGCSCGRAAPSRSLARSVLGVGGRPLAKLQRQLSQSWKPTHPALPRRVQCPACCCALCARLWGWRPWCMRSPPSPCRPSHTCWSRVSLGWYCREGPGQSQEGRGKGMALGTQQACKRQNLPAWPLPHTLLPASQVRCTDPLPAAYSMYMILSIFSDAAGATVSYVLNLPIAPHFSNPCARVWGR